MDMYQPQRICGHCREMAHTGPCEGMARGGGGGWKRDQGFSRPRYMRGGEGGADGNADLAAAINNMAETWSRSQGNVVNHGGCGPSCSANDGGLRIRGSVGEQDIDLKLGGAVSCPCAEHGGCDATKKRAQSRSRSRRRKERREPRKSRRKTSVDVDREHESSDEERSRGRRRKRQASRQTSLDPVREQPPPLPPQALEEQLRTVREHNKALIFTVRDLEGQLRAVPTQPGFEPPEARPYIIPEYGSRPPTGPGPMPAGPAYGNMPPRRQPWAQPPMGDAYGNGMGMGMGDANTPPPAYGFGPRMSRPSPLDAGMEPGLGRMGRGYPLDPGMDQSPFGLEDDLGLGFGGRRQRPGLGRMDTAGLGAGLDDWDDLDDPLQDELPSRPVGGLGGFGIRGGRGNKFRSRGGLMNRRQQLGRTRPRPTPFARGLADLGEEDEDEDNLC